MTDMTIDEAREQLAKARAVIEQAERDEKEKAQAEKRNAERRQAFEGHLRQYEQRKTFFEGVYAELKKLDPQAELKTEPPKIIDPPTNGYSFEATHGQCQIVRGKAAYELGFSPKSQYRYWSRPHSQEASEWTCSAGPYGQRRSYPMRAKTRDFNYEKIARHLFDGLEARLEQVKVHNRRRSNEESSAAIVARLNKKLAINGYTAPFSPSAYKPDRVDISLAYATNLTEEQAEQVYEAWRQFHDRVKQVVG